MAHRSDTDTPRGSVARWVLRAAAAGGRDLARALVPVACAGCGREDVRLCPTCAAPWWETPVRVESAAPRLQVLDQAALPTWAIAPMDGPSGSTIAAWKDGARRDLDRWMQAAMRRACTVVGARIDATAAAVVPGPARAASTRRRGADLPRVLARGAVQGLADAGLDARLEPVLTIGAGESRGRSARGRWRDASRSIRCSRVPRAPVLLVDDVLTTGATLAACAAALEGHGATVLGAVVAVHVDTGRASVAAGLG